MDLANSPFCFLLSWDNATRGLDANTALAYAKTMRTLTDVSGNATVVSLYQAGNQIFKQFDKGEIPLSCRLYRL